MQAIQHCGVCATGGILLSRTNFLQLGTNMAALRRGVPFVSFLRNASRALGGSRSTRQRLVQFPAMVRINWISLSVGGGLCSIPFSQQGENLSHEALIRRASSLVTDSANTYLSQTTLALVDSLTQYSKVGDRLDECKRFESNWVNAVHLCELAAEAAYSAGVEHASISTRTNLQVSQSQVERVRKLSLDAQRKLSETKAEEVQRMVEFSAMERMTEDIPEAYLRED